MTNLTISLDEDIIKKARQRAIGEGTSVSAKIREFLAQYARQSDAQTQAGIELLASARASQANLRKAQWSREDAYERAPNATAASQVKQATA